MRDRIPVERTARGPAGRLFLLAGICGFAVWYGGGCTSKALDPKQVGRFRPKPAVNVILDSLGVAPETPSAWIGAEEPRPEDVIEKPVDYVFHPGDVVRISIFELFQQGQLFINDYVVTETGEISIPEVGVIQAQGLTESQLEEEIRDILEPDYLRNASVTVRLVSSQQRIVSILGDGVGVPGRYFVPRSKFRLADALATAGGISEFNVSYIYVTRPVTGTEAVSRPAEPGEGAAPEVPAEQMLEMIEPQVRAGSDSPVVASAEMSGLAELAGAAVPDGFELSGQAPVGYGASGSASVGGQQQSEGRIQWIFEGGKWVPVQVGAEEGPRRAEPAPETGEPLERQLPVGFGWEEIGAAGVQTRVIKIPVDRFQSGDPRYNIVIKPGDTIYVPVDIVGEFFVIGNVNRQGAIPITGRPITLKMAISAAGGLGEFAWPKRCEVIRRLGKDREEIVMVDLDKIFSGEQPDFFIKVNDLINVGTHPSSQWRAVLRNAFRASYGFGFIYDRNFADIDVGQRKLTNWF